MDKQAKKLQQLVEMFEDRDELYKQSTARILDLIGPTALDALITLFDVPVQNVSWIEAQLVEDILLIVVSVEYEKDQPVPSAILELSPELPIEIGDTMTRLLRIGLPVEQVFEPAEQILEYLTTTVKEITDRNKSQSDEFLERNTKEPVPEFDTSTLSDEQRYQLLLAVGSEIEGIKH